MRTLYYSTLVLGLLLLSGCGGVRPTVFLHPEFNFGYVEKVGVVPFENISTEQGAGARATRYFLGGLLAAEAFAVAEPGEVLRALEKEALVRTGDLAEDQVKAIGRALNVQGLFLGTLSESMTVRNGNANTYTATVTIRLVETETGMTVWSATHSEDSATLWSGLFGARQKSPSHVMRNCVKHCLDTLLD